MQEFLTDYLQQVNKSHLTLDNLSGCSRMEYFDSDSDSDIEFLDLSLTRLSVGRFLDLSNFESRFRHTSSHFEDVLSYSIFYITIYCISKERWSTIVGEVPLCLLANRRFLSTAAFYKMTQWGQETMRHRDKKEIWIFAGMARRLEWCARVDARFTTTGNLYLELSLLLKCLLQLVD